jgi:hypothetical protein
MPVRSTTGWQRPGACGGESSCVEVAIATDQVLVRNSQAPGGPVLAFTHEEWVAFVGAVKSGEFRPV